MIITSINAKTTYAQYPKAIIRAIDWLKENKDNILDMMPGDYDVEGKKMFAKVFDVTTQNVEDTHPEIHKQYIDVQYWASGKELMGYAPKTGDVNIIEANNDNDLYFLDSASNEIFIPLGKDDVAVFFPEDIHRPAITKDVATTCRKVVMKVSVELI